LETKVEHNKWKFSHALSKEIVDASDNRARDLLRFKSTSLYKLM